METTTLQAEVRTSRGKGPARRLRNEGKIPAVFYGPGLDPTPLTLAPKELERALRGERGRNTVFTLEVDGKSELTMVRDLMVDPVSRKLLHVDFYRVLPDRKIDVDVPFETTGRAAGVVGGGTMNVTRRVLPLRSIPGKIPAKIEVDVSHLELFDSISVKDISFDDGVECKLKPELTLVLVAETRLIVEEETPVEGEAAAAEAGAEGAADAPADDAKPEEGGDK